MKKDKRESPAGSEYKKLEAERSGRLGQKVLQTYQSNRGLKFLFQRHNKIILESICGKDNVDLSRNRLLEIGCGMGDFLYEASKKVGEVYGIDLSEKQVLAARSDLSDNVKVLLGDAEELPFENNFFEFVVMKGVVHHLGKPEKVFKEVRRALSQNGKLIIFEGNPASWYRRAVLKTADILRIEHESSLFTHLDACEICGILEQCGFYPESKKKSGLFAPLGLAGKGGDLTWRILNSIEDILEKRLPLFQWYNLIVATRIDGCQKGK